MPPTVPPPPKLVEKGIDEIRAQITARVKPILDASWPQAVPLQSFNLAFGEAGSVLNVDYQAKRDMDTLAVELLQEQIRKSLKDPTLELVARRIAPPKLTRRQRATAH